MFPCQQHTFNFLRKTGNEMELRALLDSDSQAKFMTKAKAKVPMLPSTKLRTRNFNLGSTKAQRTQSMIVTKVNDAVERILQEVPKYTNKTPTYLIDVT